jgi:hypothetical protein
MRSASGLTTDLNGTPPLERAPARKHRLDQTLTHGIQAAKASAAPRVPRGPPLNRRPSPATGVPGGSSRCRRTEVIRRVQINLIESPIASTIEAQGQPDGHGGVAVLVYGWFEG